MEMIKLAAIQGFKVDYKRIKNFQLPLRSSDDLTTGDGDPYNGVEEGMIGLSVGTREDSPPDVKIKNSEGKLVDLTPDKLYAGCYMVANIFPYAYDVGSNKGVKAILNGVLKVAEGERLDGRVSSQQAFAEVETEILDEDDFLSSDDEEGIESEYNLDDSNNDIPF